MIFKAAHVSCDQIDETDETYRTTTQSVTDDLVHSINDLGVLNPPILEKRQDHRFTIVSGFRRIAACRHLKFQGIESRIIHGEVSFLHRIKIAVSENRLQRHLNFIEISRALNLLAGIIKDPKPLRDAASSLGLPENQKIIQKLMKLVHLPVPVQEMILSETIGLKVAMQLSTMEEAVSIFWAHLFDQLKLGLNKQKELIVMTEEISKREDVSVPDLMNHPDIRSILENREWDRSQKTELLRRYLKQQRYPELSRAEARFENNRKALKLDHHTRLHPPPFFEGQTYMFQIKFKNLAEFRDRLKTLNRMETHSGFKRMLSCIND